MGIRKSCKKMVDLRKAPKDIVKGAKKNKVLGEKLEKLAQSGKRLTQLLRSDVLKES